MVSTLTFATAEQIDAYNIEAGGTNSTTIGADGNPPTATEIASANFRGNRHIRIHWYGNFKPEFQGATLEDIPEEVRCALQEATAIASAKELETPQFFTTAIAPQTGQQPKAIDVIQLYENKTTNTATDVHTSRGQEADIGDLLDRYLLVPRVEQNACPNTTAGGAVAGFGILGIKGGCR